MPKINQESPKPPKKPDENFIIKTAKTVLYLASFPFIFLINTVISFVLKAIEKKDSELKHQSKYIENTSSNKTLESFYYYKKLTKQQN